MRDRNTFHTVASGTIGIDGFTVRSAPFEEWEPVRVQQGALTGHERESAVPATAVDQPE